MADVIHKASASPAGSDPYTYVMSDESVDRMGDVIEAKGWKLGHFQRNPIALFNHKSDFPIGHWTDVKVDGDRLVGKLNLLPAGISERLDEIRAAVDAGVLRAVSVGFSATKAEPLSNGGLRFKETELVECSLVSVPANPNALQLAKSLNISDETQTLIFGKSADEIAALRLAGEPAKTPPTIVKRATASTRTPKMATLAERIETAQTELVDLKDKLADHTKGDDLDQVVIEELSNGIEQKQAQIASLQRAEGALASKSVAVAPATTPATPGGALRLFATAAKKTAPQDLLIRAAVVQVLSHIERRSLHDVLVSRYGEDDSIKTMLEFTTKSAVAPATTTATGWAAELVQTATLDLIDSLTAKSIYPVLRDLGGRFTFGRNGVVSIPARSSTPSIAGSFVGQGAPIPVRQGGFTASTLTPKKMAVITTFTREIAEKSTPDIEQVLRSAIQEDTGVAIDTVLLDTGAATTIRPAGLRNGVTGITAASGGGFNALVADLKALVGALIASSNGNVRSPVWIMNPVQALSISLTQNAAGDFPFAADLRNGTLLGYPVAQSASVTAGMVSIVDAADFFTATGDEPRFDVSDQATLHMEDTSPLALSAAGTPNTVAAPIRSLFQTDSLGLRMVLDLNWAMRRLGMVAWVQSVTW